MSELKKELEQDKAFIEEVANKIYLDTDDIEESLPEPEWIDRMTDIADKYINRFELAQKLADKHLSSKNFQLDDNQQIVFEWLKERMTKESRGFEFALWSLLDDFGTDEPVAYESNVFRNMNSNKRKEVLATFVAWAQEQEEAE